MGESSFAELLGEASRAYKSGRISDAFHLYMRLAQGGHGESQVFVGWMFMEGKGVLPNKSEAMKWFTRAASLGSPQGAFYLARCLTSEGRHAEAIEWYRKAASGDYLPGIFWVGYALSEGKGTTKNIQEAYKFLGRAGERNHIFARRQIAVLDIKGHRGFLYRIFGIFFFVGTMLRSMFICDAGSDELRG